MRPIVYRWLSKFARRLHGELLKRLAPALADRNLALANIVAPAFRERLSWVFRGEQVFIGPVFEAERLTGPGVADPDMVIAWAAAPIRDDAGRALRHHKSARWENCRALAEALADCRSSS